MEEAASAAMVEDGAKNKPRTDDRTPGNNPGPSSEDAADRVGVFCCQDCGEAFREEATFSEHRRQHPQEKIHLDELHDAEKDNETPHFCSLCSVSFIDLSEYHLHMEKNHDQISQKESGIHINAGIAKQHTYECQDCGKSYGVIGHFLNHQRSHRQPSKSVFHDLQHLKKKSFQCESCGRNYSRASALDAHRRCHEEKLIKSRSRNSGDAVPAAESVVEAKPGESQTEGYSEKVFTCSCGKAFSALLRLKTHQRFSRNSQCSPEEMKQKPKKTCNDFYCSECKKGFNGHIALFNHQRWHANHADDSAKRFPCEECGKVFMTLTFYYRHQRTAHSDETPAKSFHHQLCQLQKKAFECKDCGLKFSRASALHSHQLHHTDFFRETEKEAQMCSSLPQEQMVEIGRREIDLEASTEGKVQLESLSPTSMTEVLYIDDSDDDMESYEPGDFNVQVISASESEDEPAQDLNPDLELVCESDQEGRDDGDIVSKPEMDLKIVQIDFEQADEPVALIAREAENKSAVDRFHCPECYRWFSSPSSLRVHRMWHGVHKRRQQTQGQSVAVYACDACGHETSSFEAHCHHIQTHTDQNPSSDTLHQAEGLEKKNLTCSECGKVFSRLSALVSHQLHHPKRKQFQCPDCTMSYLHAASLFNHMKICSAQKKENISKKEYNPKKTLLGPKIYHCEQCGKGFWSLGAFSHHKQNPTECADLRLRKGVPGSSVNGHQRSSMKVACPVCGRKFRHRGIMTLHMRKHENGNHKCELCSRSFRLFSSLLRHQVVHNDQLLPPPIKSFQHQVEQLKKNTYSCPDCGKLFSRAKALQFHMKSHGYESGHSPSLLSTVTLEDLQCATCLAHFNSKVSLRAHQKLCIKRDNQVVAKREPSENDVLRLCKGSMDASTQESSGQSKVHIKVKSEKDSLELTMENDTGEGDMENPSNESSMKYKCKKCDRSFSVVGALNFHKRIHAEGYRSLAKSKLAISAMLKKPKQEEQSKGLFHCAECGRRFRSNSALGSHKRWHKEKKSSRSLLKDDDSKSCSHKTEDGTFQCKECGKQFFNHRVLQRHQMFNPQCQSKAEPEPDLNESAESGGTLGKTFVQGSLLAAHCQNSKILETADHQGNEPFDHAPDQVDINCNVGKPISLTLKPKAHQCPLCSMSFSKARGLRAHKWQAHAKSSKGKCKAALSRKKDPNSSDSEVSKTEDSSVVENPTVILKSSPIDGERMKITLDSPPVKSCHDSREWGISDGAPDLKRVCLDVKQESKLDIQTPKAAAEVPPQVSCVLESTVKCFFKCDKCGKAFQTEDQLGVHKTKAKSRPYCCALCCQGFWTENQLHQHLAWHDEIRCRLPNEVRYRLSAAMTSKPLKPNSTADNRGNSFPNSEVTRPTFNSASQSQSSHKCQHCGKAFLSPTALQKHKTEQCNSSDSYHCSVCPRTFREIQDLIDHHQECIGDYKRQSDAPAVYSGDTNGLTCLECGTTFCQETDLHQHYIEHAHRVKYEKYSAECEDCGLKFTQQELYKTHLHQHALEEEEAQMGEHSTAELVSGRAHDGENKDEDVENTFKQAYNCLTCGKNYKYLVSFKKHQRLHKMTSSKANKINRDMKGRSRNEENVDKSDSGCSDRQHRAECEDHGLKFPQHELYKTYLHQRALEEEEAQMGEHRMAGLVSGRAYSAENRNEDIGGDAASMKNTLRKTYNCLTCGKNYKYLVSFKKHQRLHRRTSSKANKINRDMKEQLREEENVEKSDSGSSDPSEKSKSENVQSQTRGELDENKEHIVECKECGLNFTQWENYKTHLHQHALEEEEAQIEDQTTAELVSGRVDTGENRDEDMIGDAAECDSSNSAQTMTCNLIQSVGASTASVKNAVRKAYACLICGKIYTYMVSFKKHQRLHENKSSAAATSQSASNQNLRNYECPDCGMLFIRRTRLLGHLKVHRSRRSLNATPHRCDTCNKDFGSTGSWMAHTELHKQNPFWCLSCARGFRDEASLDEHLQIHDRRHRGVHTSAQLTSHFSSHSEAKQSFASPRKLISHQKWHHTAAENLGDRIRKRTLLPCVKEEPDINTEIEEPPDMEESTQKAKVQSTCEKFGDCDRSDESDCGEPVYHVKLSGKPSSADMSDLKSEDVQSQTRGELDEAESQEIIDHKYWEWECFECDMGFDEVAKLHSHYIKHATGELPILWDNTEG